jgi:RNA polymerase sigma-70 factor (ECF subfamily)
MTQATKTLPPLISAAVPGADAERSAAAGTRHLFEAHGAFVLRLVQRLGVGPSDAEDVTQEVFMIVHRRLDDLNDAAEARSWLYGIARRVVANHLRKVQRRSERLMSDGPVCQDRDAADQVDSARGRARLQQALQRLDLDKRTVFVLFELEGLEMQQVAQVVGCPLNTAYSRLYAARVLVERYVLRPKREPSP